MAGESLPVLEKEEIEAVDRVPKPLEPWNVVLLDDDDHTYEYVIEMLHRLFGHDIPQCYLMAKEVDTVGRVIVLTTHRERAELEAARIHCYGADPRIPRCKGSMSAVIEPAYSKSL